ncbi:MAG: electron transfer flavoprotein subunit beta/FixA family protein [Ignavibacteria bacterium]|nr:electron transfer flavoprotein subunit beta/FixA family protein [Ignavibacteria bacterium]
MNIAVCVNHVPDTAAKVKVSEDHSGIDTAGAAWILNPYDEFAIEEALKIKEKTGGTVYVLSFGPAENNETIRKALGMGADEGIRIKPGTAADSLNVARALAAQITALDCKLVFTGKQSVDYDNGIVGQLLAELLGYNCVSVAVALQIDGTSVVAEREIEGGREVIQTTLPAVITAQKGLNEPRYASLKGIMAAKKKVIQEVEAVTMDPVVVTQSFESPAPKTAGKILGTDVQAVPELIKAIHEEMKLV